jgi:hypothetical protein
MIEVNMRGRIISLSLGLVLVLSSAGWAQIAWDSPQLVPPTVTAAPEFGLFLIDGSGAGIGVMGMWRGGSQPRLGLRFGIADRGGRDGGIAAFGGGELIGPLTVATPDFPLDISWLFGMGIGLDNRVRVAFPLGLSVGHTFTGQGVTFAPYLTPRVVLDGVFGGHGDGLDMGLAVDLGFDIGFQPNWLIRFGGTFGDRSALALGVVF